MENAIGDGFDIVWLNLRWYRSREGKETCDIASSNIKEFRAQLGLIGRKKEDSFRMIGAPNMERGEIKTCICERLYSQNITMIMGLSSTRSYEEDGNKLGRKELHSREVASLEVIRKNHSRKEII